MRLKPEFIPPEQFTDDDISFFIEASRRHAELLDELHAALETGDDACALAVARRLTGLQQAAAK